MTTAQPKSLSLLRTIQADNLLGGYAILTALQGLRGMMVYRGKSFADYFDQIQNEVGKLGHLQLRADVDPISASSYLVDLTMGYERTLDDISRVTIDAQAFFGKLKVVHNKAVTLKAPFMVLWSWGVQEVMKENTALKFNATDLKALAASEFTFLVNEADMELAAMIEAMDLTLENLKNLRRLASDKYAIGKDQVNAALSDLDYSDKGIAAGAPKSHRPGPGDAATMKGMFGDRVQSQAQPSTGPVLSPDEDDFPHEVEAADLDALDTASPEQVEGAFQQAVADLDAPVISNGGVASEGEEEHFREIERRQGMVAVSHTMSEHPGQENLGPVDLDAPVTVETPVLTPDGPVPAGELKVGDTVLVTGAQPELEGTHVVAAEIKPPQNYRLEKPGKGKPVVVFFNIDITACPPLVVPELLMGVGKTKLQLTAQDKPEENGVYRWHGAGSALVRIEEKAADAPGPETAPKPPKLVTPDDHKIVEPPAEPVRQPRPEPQVVVPDVKKVIEDDPFLSQAQKDAMLNPAPKPDDDDDFPTSAPEAPAQTGLALDEDDFPGAAPEPNAQAPLDDDDDFPSGQPVVDKTPATQELKEGVQAEAPEPPPVVEKAPEAPKPEPEKPKQVEAPKPDPAVATPKPGGLFRSRTLPPNQTAAPTFRPTKPVEGVQVTGDGLDEVL